MWQRCPAGKIPEQGTGMPKAAALPLLPADPLLDATAHSTALSLPKERDVQSGSDGHEAERVPPVSTKGAGKANQFSSLSFPEKLWKMLESDEFRSIWWSQGGKYVAINEKLFEEEVLGRERPLRVFATQKMKSIIRQLNAYGFTKILYYYNPTFNREHPHLLEKCKRKAVLKRRAPRAPEVDEWHASRSPDSQPAWDAVPSPPEVDTPTMQWPEAPPGLGSAYPSPPAAGSGFPEPDTAEDIESLTSLAFFPTTEGSQTPGGLQHAALWLAMHTLAAASALLKPRPPRGQSPRVHHCPTCTCSPSPADAGRAFGPQRGPF
uniref:HSF-type DNA-binding domain-containing protein n=1 Tax=Accipiter nisus TaxID=211598 RepID=A0A8B9S0M4_9AVES